MTKRWSKSKSCYSHSSRWLISEELHYCLRIATRTRTCITQIWRIHWTPVHLEDDWEVQYSKVASTPADRNVRLCKDDGVNKNAMLYQSIVGSLLIAAMATRRDHKLLDLLSSVQSQQKLTWQPLYRSYTTSREHLTWHWGTTRAMKDNWSGIQMLILQKTWTVDAQRAVMCSSWVQDLIVGVARSSYTSFKYTSNILYIYQKNFVICRLRCPTCGACMCAHVLIMLFTILFADIHVHVRCTHLVHSQQSREVWWTASSSTVLLDECNTLWGESSRASLSATPTA